MFSSLLGSGLGPRARAVELAPDPRTRSWITQGLSLHRQRLGPPAQGSRLFCDPVPGGRKSGQPGDLDGLFDLVCAVQAQVGQDDVEFTLLENDATRGPGLPEGFSPLGDPTGQLLHGFHRDEELVLVFSPAIFRVPALLYASVAREVGRVALHLAGGHHGSVDPADREADTELASIALGLGVWVANGAYLFENACCGGGCGIDLRSLRAGLSMPEACFAVAVDGRRRGVSRRALARLLEPTQRAAFKRSWSLTGEPTAPQLPNEPPTSLRRLGA